MTAHSTALGLASLGRHGDDTLVHMSHDEVQGLQALAQQHGTTLTVNPHTGMPEAFSLGGIFKSLLPVAAGFALGPGGFGMFEGPNAALMSGLTVGAATGLLTGNLGAGLMAGFGAYGGAGLGDMFSKLGVSTPMTPEATTGLLEKSTGANLVGGPQNEIGMFNKFPGTVSGASPFSDVGLRNIPMEGGQVGAANSFPPTMGGSGPINPTSGMNTSGFSNSSRGVGSLFDTGGWDRARGILGTQGTPAGTTLAKDIAGNPIEIQTAAKAGTPLTNMQLAGKIALPVGGVLAGGIEPSDLYPQINYKEKTKHVATGVDANGNPIYSDIGITKYSPYETLNLNDPYSAYGITPPPALKLPPTLIAKEGGEVKSYAIGGNVGNSSTGAGISDLYNTSDGTGTPNISQDGYGIGRLSSLANAEAMNTAKSTGYAEGGETHMNLDELPSLNVNTGVSSLGGTDGNNLAPNMLQNAPQLYMAAKLFGMNPATMSQSDLSNLANTISNPKWSRGYAHGGYLDGQGDGMSDSIPATIEGKQPARLADGEFVVPADVVSHIGNGSSKAGSQRLYSMLDRVRKARTGTMKQGKQIKAEKYLPA